MGLFSKKRAHENFDSICSTTLIGGEAGEGIKSAGKLFALSIIKDGYQVFVYDEYPSLIRGGHNSVNITFSKLPVYSHNSEIDILVCLDKSTFQKHKSNLHNNSVIIFDPEDFEINIDEMPQVQCEVIEVSAKKIINSHNLPQLIKNTLLTTAALLVMGVPKKHVVKALEQELAGKKLLPKNIEAVDIMYTTYTDFFNFKKNQTSQQDNLGVTVKQEDYLMSGNEAIALGALKSGLNFYAAYPMTPATTILTYLFEVHREMDIIVKQAEDEIAAINMAIGASFAGARAMVGTSGGGFSLMVEGVGLAAITETPLVVVLSQRPGPATGMPTWTAQSDLLFTIHASQDEFPRVVFTPTDAEEAFYLSFQALNIAEKYQLPVFILVDKYLSESLYNFSLADLDKLQINRGLLLNERILYRLENYNRFEFTKDGISPRSIPGQYNGVFLANSDESDVKGYTTEDHSLRKAKMEKRFLKIKHLKNDLPQVNVYGNTRSKYNFVTWGSTKGATLEAMRRLQSKGIESSLLALNYVEPFPVDDVTKYLQSAKNIIGIENNYTGQLAKLITMHTGYEIKNQLLKFDGQPIHPKEIVDFVN